MNSYTLIALSLFMMALSLFFKKKTKTSLVFRIIYSIIFFVNMMIITIFIGSDFFTANGIDDSVIYHLQYGVEGAGFFEYLPQILLSAFLVCFYLFVVIRYSLKNGNSKKISLFFGVILTLFTSVLINPGVQDLYSLFGSELLPNSADNSTSDSLFVVDTTAKIDSTELHYQKLIKEDKTDFYSYYRIPKIQKIDSLKQKNLVLIYLESFERTYFNERVFPGLITDLKKIENSSTTFTNIKQVMNSKWTIAGMVSGQCGVPLFTSSHENSMSGMDLFLPSAKSLGDLLKSEGYYLSFMGGADHDFAGKGKFYSTHCFDEVLGKHELLPQTPNPEYKNHWGLYDDALLPLAKEKFYELAKSKEKFAFVLLTLDTHHPQGMASKSIRKNLYQDGSNQMLNVIKGSDKLVSEFINEIKNSPYADSCVIVVVSDHQAMKNEAYDKLTSTKRSNLFMVLDNEGTKKVVNKKGSVLDIGTTILPFLGYTGQIGLGRNLRDTSLADEELEYIQQSKNLKRWRSSISKFWDFPKIENKLTFSPETKTVNIDNRIFKYPVLIEFDEDLNSTVIFDFYRARYSKRLEHYAQALNPENGFLIINKGKDLRFLSNKYKGKNFYAVGVRKGKIKFSQMVSDSLEIEAELLRDFF